MNRKITAALRRVDAARKIGYSDEAKRAAKEAIRRMEKRK